MAKGWLPLSSRQGKLLDSSRIVVYRRRETLQWQSLFLVGLVCPLSHHSKGYPPDKGYFLQQGAPSALSTEQLRSALCSLLKGGTPSVSIRGTPCDLGTPWSDGTRGGPPDKGYFLQQGAPSALPTEQLRSALCSLLKGGCPEKGADC